MALVALYLGETDEEKINNMSYIFFEKILEQLGHKLYYDAVVNLAGNSFCEKSGEVIFDANPMNVSKGNSGTGRDNKVMNSLADMINRSEIKVLGQK